MQAERARRRPHAAGPHVRPATGVDESVFRSVEVAGLELAVVDTGPTRRTESAARGDDLPLVLVHGFTGHRDDWIGLVPWFAERRRVIAFDLPGHGDSLGWTDAYDYSFRNHTNLLQALLDELEIPRCHLLGHSVGGMIALRFALADRGAEPARLRSLILMNTAAEVPGALSRVIFEKAAAIATARGVDFLQSLTEKAGREARDPILERWRERYWAHHRRRLCAMSPTSYAGLGAALFDSESLVESLPSLHHPTLVIVGDQDHDFLPGADLLESHLPRVHRETIPQAGHHPHQENPDAFRRALEAHFERLP